MAARPRTLPVAVGPVLVGTAVAAGQGEARGLPALAALAGALLLQVASNLANDLFDFEKGADADDRIGPPRASQLGWLSPRQMRAGIGAVLACAAAVGLYLVAVAGWPVLAVGLVSMGAALAYTGGPWPYGYKGWGDPAVFLFFGVVAVMGTHFVQAGWISAAAALASLPVGAMATAILVVNNVRDIESDRRAGKRTLAVRLGRAGGVAEYRGLLVFAYACLPLFVFAADRSAWVLLPLLTLPRARSLQRSLREEVSGVALSEVLAGTARLGFVFCLLLSAGWLL
jgi:1,4-dihydroxy-2-naphthoate octaprenyltransferase